NKTLPKAKEPKNRTNIMWQKHLKYPTINILNKLYRTGIKLSDLDNLDSQQQLENIELMRRKLGTKHDLDIQPYPEKGSIINTQPNGITQIITDPILIKDKVKDHLYQWTKGIEIDSSIKNTRWENRYKPIPSINIEIYDPLLKEINKEEIKTVIKLMSNNKAPGPSLIPYEIFKHLDEHGLEMM
ncbi:13098_t:CDS:2, partial [Dentiscutata erythropus]